MNQFINGLEFANLAVCSDLPLKAWDAISEIPPIDETSPTVTVRYRVCEIGSNGMTVIAFGCWSSVRNYLQGEEGKSLVMAADSPLFKFLCTKKHPTISLHRAAIDHFVNLLDELSALKGQIDVKSPLIITGHSLGGSIASLFTLWLLDSIYSKTSKRPLCITFGSPLVGDNAFQEAISEHPTWISCFLHIISNHDPIPTALVTSTCYMPFGTTLFLSDSGAACFDESGSVLELIKAMSSGDLSLEIVDYGGILKKLKCKAISGENELVGEPEINTLREGITLQVQAATGANQEITEMEALITKLEKKIEKFLKRKRNGFDHTKKLNENKIYMAYMEWYKKVTMEDGGYYDNYKNTAFKSGKEKKSREEIVKHQRILTQYWKYVVTEIEKMPKREGENIIRSRWLYGGTNYRRMVEPLDIAEYYKQGKRDYLKKGRAEHYKLLEQWQKNDKPIERRKACSMTEDSCFWAHVEEAILSCNVLKDEKSSLEDKELSSSNLITFEKYVMGLLGKYAISPEIFLEGSSFMKWWIDYKRIKGTEYESDLTAFMKNEKLENESMVLQEYINSS